MLMPWESGIVEQTTYQTRIMGYSSMTATRIVINMDDAPTQNFRKGDIVKFRRGYLKDDRFLPGWVSWFAKEKDKIPHYPIDKTVPKYAASQYGIVIGRYKVKKIKWSVFNDYGVIVMLISGPSIGRVRRFYCGNPFKHSIKFPKKIKWKYLQRIIPNDILEIYNSDYENSNEGRNLLVSTLYNKLNQEE